MARYSHHIFKVYIADGFTNDCDDLIQKCLQMKTLDYQTFCNFWKNLNFGSIYQGRTTGAEIAELSEEVVHIAKHYMVKDTSNIEESIAGLFLVYGLLKLQPFSGFVCLSIVPDDLKAINKIEIVARRDKRLDVLYILGEVLIKCSQYHVVERERGIESVLRKYLEGHTSVDKLGVRPNGVLLRQSEELDHIRDMGQIVRQYVRAKASFKGDGVTDSSLKYILNDNLPNYLDSSLRKVINGIVDNNLCNDEEDEDPDGHYNNVKIIKDKAMTNTVNRLKHLQGVGDCGATTTSLEKKSDLKSPTGKLKTGSPTKVVTNSPQKNKISSKQKRKGKKDQKIVINTDNNVELNLEEFNMEVARKDDIHIQETKIDIDMIPLVFKSDDTQIEIEIIDNIDQNVARPQNTKIVEENENSNETNVWSNPIKKKRRNKRDAEPSVQNVERKEHKQPKLKSKFKKLGILPVANLNLKNKE